MKILILAPRLPHAHGKADSMTVYRMIRYFAQRHEVSLACFYDEDAELEHLQELKSLCVNLVPIKLRKWQAALNMLSALASRNTPLQVAYYRDGRMRKAVQALIAETRPDLAYAHLIRMAGYLADEDAMPRVLAMQISQTLNYRRMLANIRSIFYKILYGIEYNRVRRYEPAITRRFTSCLLISQHDKQSMEGHEAIHNIFYSPHGVDVAYYTASNKHEKENAILFCGVLETPTNMDAVLYFYEEIYPLVKKRVPDVRLYLAGKNPPPAISKLAESDPSVVVTGFVKDIRPYYEKARVGIDPLRIGAGLQNKLLIGMSMGQPMVCTSVANEGIAAEPGSQVLIADNPSDFAAAIIGLLTDHEKAVRLAQNARKYIQEKWTWEYHFEALDRHFQTLRSKCRS